jgi:hypothetical protein
VHLYCVSYIVSEDENEQVTADEVTKLSISADDPLVMIANP